MKSVEVATLSALAAHVLAWAGGVFLAFVFVPLYGSGETLVEVNGRGAIRLLLVPVVLTGIALAAALLTHRKQSNRSQATRTMLLWSSAIVLLGLCFVAIFSVGVFYLPAALALFVAAIADSVLARSEPRTGP